MPQASACLSRFPRWEIRTLSGCLIAHNFISAISGGYGQWAKSRIADEFNCQPCDVSCVEDDGYVDCFAVDGRKVAYLQVAREPVDALEFLQAAE
jgi:hypothetical protein